MTVNELIKELQQIPDPEAVIVTDYNWVKGYKVLKKIEYIEDSTFMSDGENLVNVLF